MTKNNKNNTHSKENNEGTEQNKRRGRRTSLTHSSKQSVEYSKQRRKSVNSLGTKGKGQLATVQSIQEIITDIRKLPTVSLEAEEDHSTWTRDRRHSEPYSHNKMNRSHSKKGDTLDTIEEIPSNPSNLFQKENKDEKNELVSPSEKQMTRRNRSKSVPNAFQATQDTSGQRKALYPAYLSAPEASAAIRQRTLFAGVLKVSAQDSSDAHVQCEELDAPIYIYGSRNRNRALDGDEVAIELVSVDDMMHEKKAKLEARRMRRMSSGHPLQPFTEESNQVGERPKYCGKVVCILERPRNMLFAGTLSLYRPLSINNSFIGIEKSHSSPKIIWLIPVNKRLPLVAVPIKFAPPDFVKYHEEYKNRLFVGSIQRWPASSLHPFGTIENEIGWIGELSVHSGTLVADHHLKGTNYSVNILKTIEPKTANINNSDRKGRRNFQNESMNIFTLGESDKDTDVAFSITRLENGTYEIGIHVTDVANYVRPGTPLDKEARERSCTINLVEKTIPVLPPSFVESHCRLVADKERLTISLLCRFTESGTLLHTWVGRSIIKSKGHVKPSDIGNNKSEIEKDAFTLLNLCRKLRHNRVEKGRGFGLVSQPITFQLGDSGYPEDIKRIELAEEDILKGELLRIANIEVGQKISSKFPDQALMYREEPLKLSVFSMIQNYFNSDPLCLSIHGLVQLIQKEPDSEKQQALKYMVLKELPRSIFYSAGSIDISKYQHFEYDAPLYTIFTEPTHTYASIIAQRQLTMALKGGKQIIEDYDMIDKIARHCNATLVAKQSAEQESKRLYIAAYIYRQSLEDMKTKKVKSQCIVIGFESPNILFLYFPKYDLELPIACNENSMPGSNANQGVFDPELKQMCLTWNIDKRTFAQKIEFLSKISVNLYVDMQTVRPLFFVELLCN